MFQRVALIGCLALFTVLGSGVARSEADRTCEEANETASPKWNCYQIYDPKIEHVTIYDADVVDTDKKSKKVSSGFSNRVIESPKDKVLMCATNANSNINPNCTVDPTNSQVVDWYWFQYRRPSVYNHMSALAFFDGSWYAMWGSNNKRSPNKPQAKQLQAKGEIPKGFRIFPSYARIEGLAGQRIFLSKSPQKSDSAEGRREAYKQGWSDPDAPDAPPDLSNKGVFRQQLLRDQSKPFDPETNPENPDNRQWVPDLLVVDVDPAPDKEQKELWAFFTQNLGVGRGTYFARLKSGDGEWSVRKLNLKKTSLKPKSGYVFNSANAIQLQHQSGKTADRNGWVLVPVTPQNETDKDVVNDIAVLYTKDGGETWGAFPRITPDARFDLWEPMLVESPTTGQLFLYVRNRNKKDSPSSEMIIYSTSTDGGDTWSPFEPMPLEVPSLRAHAFSIGDRVVLIQHDFENGFSKGKGARQGERTGRIADGAPVGAAAPNERLNMALFFSRTGKIGSFMPGIAFTNNQEDVRTERNQRGTSYPHMTLIDDTLYVMHSSERSIRGEIISPMPPKNSYLLLPRSAVEIYKDGAPGWDRCPEDEPGVDYNRDDLFKTSYCTYKPTTNGSGMGYLTKQASVGVETDVADYDAGQMLQFQFDFASLKPEQFKNAKQRMALLTIGGPDEYGVVEVGHPGMADKVVYVQGKKVTVLGDYKFWTADFGVLTVFLYKDGVTLVLGGNKPVTVKKPIRWQKIFLGYGYTQGAAYKEQLFNPDGWFRYRSGHVKSRIVQQADLKALLKAL